MATELITIDARGLKCPLPVLKLEKAASGAQPGQVIVVLATDAMAKIDIPLYCRQNGHSCDVSSNGELLELTIQIKANA